MSQVKKIFLALTRSERMVFLSAALLAAISAAILAGIGVTEYTKVVPTSGGDYAEGFIGQPTYVNPVIASSVVDKSIVRLVFSNIPDVAEKIETSPDGRAWDVRIKEGLLWHDGEKLTTDDIIFTIQKIQDRESASPLARAWQGISTRRVSELELQINLVNPYAFFKETLNSLYILPKHLFAAIPPANWKLSDYNIKPVGSGPYRFSSYDKRSDGFISLYRLESWDGNPERKPLIRNFDLKFFSNEPDLIRDFNFGQIDAVAGLEPNGLAQVKRPHETFSFSLPNYYAVFLNQGKSVPLKDVAVRKALSISVDKQLLINDSLGGRGKVAIGPIPEGTVYFNEELEPNPASLSQASDTLEKAGWKMDEIGFREKTVKSTKLPLELTLTVPQIEFLVRTAETLVKTWQEIGFKINLNVVGLEEVSKNVIRNRDYEMLLFGNVLNKNFDLSSFWHSSERFYPGLNLALYNNKKADSILESIRVSASEEARRSKFHDLQKTIVDDYPAVFLYSTEYVYITTKNLHGPAAAVISDPAERFVDVSKWYLKTARVLK